MAKWHLFHGNGQLNENAQERLYNLQPPPWRQFGDRGEMSLEANDFRWQKLLSLANAEIKTRDRRKGMNFRISKSAVDVINAVNAAIYLRRPLLVTGMPGSGKTSLAYAIAYELNLGPVLSWSITARSNLQEGLYRYDAIARLQDTNQSEKKDIGEYISLGPVGTAFLPSLLPRVLLIDEIDKSDINLPNDLLNLFEEGEFKISELVRRSEDAQENTEQKTSFTAYTQDQDIKAQISGGWVRCYAFPIIVMTSNGERDFPPAFKRRCLRVGMPAPQAEELVTIVKAHFGEKLFMEKASQINNLIEDFLYSGRNKTAERATDQLLNTVYLFTNEMTSEDMDKQSLQEILFKRLTSSD